MIVDRAIYRDGVRAAEPRDLAAMRQVCRDGGGIAWIGLFQPTAAEFADIADEFDLHMGMTDELNVSHWFKRLTAIELSFGDTDTHLQRFAALSAN